MAEPPESVVNRLLHPSEDVKIALDVMKVEDRDQESDSGSDEAKGLPGMDQQRTQDRGSTLAHIIAAVSHLDTSTGDEQGWFVLSAIIVVSRGAPTALQA